MASKFRAKDRPVTPHVKEDLAAAVAARREVGEQYEDHVAAALAQRIETFSDERVEAAMGRTRKRAKSDLEAFLKVATPVLGFGIVLSIVGAIVAGSNGFLAVLGMIFLINAIWLYARASHITQGYA